MTVGGEVAVGTSARANRPQPLEAPQPCTGAIGRGYVDDAKRRPSPRAVRKLGFQRGRRLESRRARGQEKSSRRGKRA